MFSRTWIRICRKIGGPRGATFVLTAALSPAWAQYAFQDGFETVDARPAAAAFLQRATFGPRMDEIDRVAEIGAEAWIDEQLRLPISITAVDFEPLAMRNFMECEDDPFCIGPFLLPDDRHNRWWQTIIAAPDQLRHRMAFALSQIMVVSERDGVLVDQPEGLAHYYDMLLTNAFGNFRELLEDVTLSPVMGIYLSHLGNQAAVQELNIRPDENFAREVMQLFSIGLDQLDIDGSRLTDAEGQTVPTYTQAHIEAMARVFTGWNFAGIDCEDFPDPEENYLGPMEACDEFHDQGAKRLPGGVELPAGQTAAEDLTGALDALFNHPNVGPFIGRQLIQRLVTSNPSPAYIARVAAVFNDNGSGIRGDLGAVAKAILLDVEALDGTAARANFGKLREPLLRLTHLWRTFDGRAETGEYYQVVQPFALGQAVLAAPSVFNFFLPNYQPPGPLQAEGLFGPEFQLASDDLLTENANILRFSSRYFIDGAPWTTLEELAEIFTEDAILIRPTAELAIHDDARELLDRLDLLLLAGKMSAGLRQMLWTHLTADYADADPHSRVGEMLSQILASPEYLIQR